MATLDTWSPKEDFVQGGLTPGQYLTSEAILLASGPPSLSAMGGVGAVSAAVAGGAGTQLAFPVGMLQGFNVGHNRTLNRLFEIGSSRSHFISGRTVGQINMNRAMYHGPSLLRVLYAYYQDLVLPVTVLPVFPNIGIATMANPHDVKVPPGYENLFFNLASDLFDQPVGMLLYVKDSNEDTVGAGYLEYCYVPNHGFGFDANGVVVQEQCSLQFERLVPVAVSGLGLITGSAADAL